MKIKDSLFLTILIGFVVLLDPHFGNALGPLPRATNILLHVLGFSVGAGLTYHFYKRAFTKSKK